MCCHIETEVADQTFHLVQSQYTDTGPTDPEPGVWQGSDWSGNVEVIGMTRPRKILAQVGFEPGSFTLEVDALTIMPVRNCVVLCLET